MKMFESNHLLIPIKVHELYFLASFKKWDELILASFDFHLDFTYSCCSLSTCSYLEIGIEGWPSLLFLC